MTLLARLAYVEDNSFIGETIEVILGLAGLLPFFIIYFGLSTFQLSSDYKKMNQGVISAPRPLTHIIPAFISLCLTLMLVFTTLGIMSELIASLNGTAESGNGDVSVFVFMPFGFMLSVALGVFWGIFLSTKPQWTKMPAVLVPITVFSAIGFFIVTVVTLFNS